MSTVNLALGRLGAQGMIKVLSGLITTAYRDVDKNATFTAGTVVKLAADANGNAVVTPVTAVGDSVIGIAFEDKATAFYVPVIDEVVTIASDKTINLANVLVDAASIRVAGKVITTDYTITDATKGILTSVTGTAGQTVTVSYLYKDTNKAAMDQTIGSGKVSVIEGKGEISTLIYDTSTAYTLGGNVYFTAAGIPTAKAGTTIIGTVTKVPTANDATLCIKASL